jgi:enterochelin esterase-like enzyme
MYPLGQVDSSPVIIFNDGAGHLGRKGHIRATIVLDNLLAAGHVEPTIAVFINSGTAAEPDDTRIGPNQHSYEYDSVTPDFGHFLISEALPYIENDLGITSTTDPALGVWYQQWWYLCMQCCLASSPEVCTRIKPRWFVHQYSRPP